MMDSKQREIVRILTHDRAINGHASALSQLRPSINAKVNGITHLDAWDALVAYVREAEDEKEQSHEP